MATRGTSTIVKGEGAFSPERIRKNRTLCNVLQNDVFFLLCNCVG